MTEELYELVYKAVERAHDREMADWHLSDAERQKIVAAVEFVAVGRLPKDYPVDGDMTHKFIFIIFDWFERGLEV